MSIVATSRHKSIFEISYCLCQIFLAPTTVRFTAYVDDFSVILGGGYDARASPIRRTMIRLYGVCLSVLCDVSRCDSGRSRRRGGIAYLGHRMQARVSGSGLRSCLSRGSSIS